LNVFIHLSLSESLIPVRIKGCAGISRLSQRSWAHINSS